MHARIKTNYLWISDSLIKNLSLTGTFIVDVDIFLMDGIFLWSS
jgi:hypothetical protein